MDSKNVIEGLEHCKNGDCVGCPYDQIREKTLHGKRFKWQLTCNEQLTEDIIALLKEQDERIKLLEHQQETITKWRMNAGAFD